MLNNLEENAALFEDDERKAVDEVVARWLHAGPQSLPEFLAAYLNLFEEH